MGRRHTDNYTFLTQAPAHRVILTMAVPTIITMLVTSLYNIADTFFVGQLDTQSTAAVGVVFPVMFFIQAFGFFFGHGSGNYISRELGARRHGNAETMASTGFVYSLVAGTVAMVVGLYMIKPLAVWLGSTPTILPYTESYMSIILLGAPFMTASLTINNQMRLQGNASYAMYGIISGAVLNVVLDPVFIFVFDMGVAGAAVATVTGQVVGFFVLLAMSRRGENIRLDIRRFSPRLAYLKEIVYGGSPSLSRQGLGCVAVMMLNVAASEYGDAAIAAMSIVSRITMFIMSVVLGLGQGFQPFCGFCYGAGLYGRLREGFGFIVKVGTAFLLVFFLQDSFQQRRHRYIPRRLRGDKDRRGGTVLAACHLSFQRIHHGRQHDAPDHPQAVACKHPVCGKAGTVLHSAHCHTSIFLRSEGDNHMSVVQRRTELLYSHTDRDRRI